MKYLAPAKVNLYLEVVSKRADSYHSIQTVMQTVSLYDELEIESLPKGIEFVSDHPLLSKEKNNLILSAVNLLQKFNKKKRGNHLKGAKIILRKKIPLASGLGGGSSDAICVLKVLNYIWKLNLSQDVLLTLAKKIGADAPFFLQGGYAYAQGIGEKVSLYSFSPYYWLVLVNPGFPIYSKEIYAEYDRLKQFAKLTPSALLRMVRTPNHVLSETDLPRRQAGGLTKGRNFNKIKNCKILWEKLHTAKDIAKNLFNHLEDVVLPKYPEIAKIKKVLISLGAFGSLMSGSGPTVFAIVENEKRGKEIIKKLKRYPWQTWLVKTIASSATCRKITV